MTVSKGVFIAIFILLSVPLLVVANASTTLFQPTHAVSNSDAYLRNDYQDILSELGDTTTSEDTATVYNSDGNTPEQTISGTYETTNGKQVIPNLDAYWGIVDDPEPIGTLTGYILSLGYNSQTQELIRPYLCMKGPYQSDEIHLNFPLEENPFEGLLFPYVGAPSEDITGSYWGTGGDPGDFIAFFIWNGDTYWIMGDSYNMETWLE